MQEAMAWQGVLDGFPLADRRSKPRISGHTMVLDKGLGLWATRDLLDLAAEHIDLIKLAFGTSALYPERLLREKIRLIKSYGVDVCPGGTFLEAAVWQGRLSEYLRCANELGFTCVEVSDGTIEMDQATRINCITLAKEAGFWVNTEVGKKLASEQASVLAMRQQIVLDLQLGADMVIVEARESGKGVGIFDRDGQMKEADLLGLLQGVTRLDQVLWEAPLKEQQVNLISRFGSNVNLGNIAPAEVIALEALRVGLRADTLKLALARTVTDRQVSTAVSS